MERKLASIQRVLEILPIEGADAIELVKINGWQCVTKKKEFQRGDLGVFLEIDAIPPDEPRFRFLWTPRNTPPEEVVERPAKFRIRTMKLRGALSQGLFLPLDGFEFGPVSEGDDVTEQVGVGKYEPPIPVGMGDFRAQFPGFAPKTDEMRVQSFPGVLDELRGQPYVATLKYDGTSATFLFDERRNEFHACGRNFSIQEGTNVYWRVARAFDLEAKLRHHPGLAWQGEIVGPGVQKNRLELKELGFFIFSIFDFREARYLTHDEVREVSRRLDVPVVAEVERGTAFDHSLESLLKLAEGLYPGTSNEREGIVIRPLTEQNSAVLGGRLSFKAISNRFLLKEE